MLEPFIGFGGFFLALLTFTAIVRWVGVIYIELVNQPPEVRRPQTIVPIVLLHSGPWMLALLIVQAIANGIYSPLTKPLLNAEIVDSRRRAAVLSVDSMVRRAAMGVFAPLAGLYGQADVMMLCAGVGIAGMVVLAVARSAGDAEVRLEQRGETSVRVAALDRD